MVYNLPETTVGCSAMHTSQAIRMRVVKSKCGYLQFSPLLVCFLYHPGHKINNNFICYFITHVLSILNKKTIFMLMANFLWMLNLNRSDESKVIQYSLLLL